MKNLRLVELGLKTIRRISKHFFFLVLSDWHAFAKNKIISSFRLYFTRVTLWDMQDMVLYCLVESIKSFQQKIIFLSYVAPKVSLNQIYSQMCTVTDFVLITIQTAPTLLSSKWFISKSCETTEQFSTLFQRAPAFLHLVCAVFWLYLVFRSWKGWYLTSGFVTNSAH